MDQANDSIKTMTLTFYQWVGAWCLSLAGPTMAYLKGFFSINYMLVIRPFHCFIIVC